MATHGFKRVVLGLQPSAPERTVRFAADLADLLHLELLGLFLEDINLRDLASIPFVREFRPLGGGWQPIDLERLSHDLEVAARSAERAFADAVKRLSVRCEFTVIRGPTAQSIESISRTDDIVVIVEPMSAAERATQQFLSLVEAAFRSAASVMLVPTEIARTTGPVVAIAITPDDPSIRIAAGIAMAAKEDLVILDVAGGKAERHVQPAIDQAALNVRYVAVQDARLSHRAGCEAAFHNVNERLIVMTRGALDNATASSIASWRRVPVLITERPDALGGAEQRPA